MTGPIHHIEMTVSNMQTSAAFYGALLRTLGWTELRRGMYIRDGSEIYLKETKVVAVPAHVGPRHICFRAGSRAEVDQVGRLLHELGAVILRGPIAMPEYGGTYYTVDFRDPDGFVLEVAHP